jgi:hypothetical protein
MGDAFLIQNIKVGFRSITATGGTITDIGDYRYHAFTSTGTSTFSVQNLGTDGELEYLIVAGGGGGGAGRASSSWWGGGGGGAGGLLTNATTDPLSIDPQNYTITVGAGGSGQVAGTNHQSSTVTVGGNSSAFGLTAFGGGPGASYIDDGISSGRSGGSGGGASVRSSVVAGGSGVSGQGNNGGSSGGTNAAGGGGGGAGSAGENGSNTRSGNGGSGLNLSAYFPNWGTNSSNTITGTRGWFAGGGGSGATTGYVTTPGAAGIGGGAIGRLTATGQAFSAIANTGGGGGGVGGTGTINNQGGNGGSGIVIIRYPLVKVN